LECKGVIDTLRMVVDNAEQEFIMRKEKPPESLVSAYKLDSATTIDK